MIFRGYHGTNQPIEHFNMDKLGSNQGQSVFPGIYFASSYREAKYYADLAVEKSGGNQIVYFAEVEVDSPLLTSRKVFNSYSEIISFVKEYFPGWFDENGELFSYKVGYVKEKLQTYTGNYNLIQYAAKENGLPLIEVMKSLRFDSCKDGSDFVITSPQQINWYTEVDKEVSQKEIEEMTNSLPSEEELDDERFTTQVAFETKSNDYVRAAKKGKPYKTMPGNRFLRRVKIQLNGGNNVWFDLDVNRLFKRGSFAIKIPVVGETDRYVCQISFDDWLPKLKDDILKSGFTQMTVKRSLMEMLRFHDLKLRCSCPDFKYRHSYFLTVHNEIEGDPETRPSKITNPKDDLGKICKHLSLVINNKIYGDKISRIIYNYFINLKKSQKMLFDKIVAPKLGLDILAKREEEAKLKQEEELKRQEEGELKMNGVEEEPTEEEKQQAIKDSIGSDGDDTDEQ